ncbi:MAG TPA: response regulator [Clostridia bacterium]|nr:response regulator [Clostridia bacterium]
MKILYVENHPVFANEVCHQFLAAEEVRVVPSLAAARQALAAESFDLLLIDYDLEDGKGDELVRMCRVLHPELRAIAVSAHEDGNTALVKAGAVAVCGKMELEKIQSVIASLARKLEKP